MSYAPFDAIQIGIASPDTILNHQLQNSEARA